MRISGNRNDGIGIVASPDQKLAAKDEIHSEEVIVLDLDDVFEEDCHLLIKKLKPNVIVNKL